MGIPQLSQKAHDTLNSAFQRNFRSGHSVNVSFEIESKNTLTYDGLY